jgi:anti-anti-sigma regulatory factor
MGARKLVLDCSSVPRGGLEQVDALAGLCVRLRRRRCGLQLTGVPDELRELIELCGLDAVLGVEPRGQAEEREVALGLEEEGQL